MSADLSGILLQQRKYFSSGVTRPYSFRKDQLNLLRSVIKKYEPEITAGLYADLNKSAHECYMTEIGPVLAELRFIKNHLKKWMKPQHTPGMIFSFPSHGTIYAEPYGTVLIISPWNYPFWLALNPLIGAIAAGNCVMLKPSEHAPHTASILKKMMDENFPNEFIAVVEGNAEVSRQLTELPPDYIFFTGSTGTGRMVAEAAAKNLTPYTLELGGKSPCIVDQDTDIGLAAKRILWGKTITAGQTCVAPDYLLVHKKVKDEFIDRLGNILLEFYPEGALKDQDFPRIINQHHYDRLQKMMTAGKILIGGRSDPVTLKIEPTVVENISFDDPIMREEIFGPLLPVFTFDSTDEVIKTINNFPDPLSLYIFSGNKKFQQQILDDVSFGGACINDTIEHLGNSNLPFGGIGTSGTGAYLGKFSFDTFSHFKGVMKKATWIDLPFRYKPFTKWKGRILRTFLR